MKRKAPLLDEVGGDAHPLVMRLQQRDELSPEERLVLEQAAMETQTFAAGEALAREGEVLNFSSLLLEGWTGRVKRRASGERAITAFHVAGDFVDLQSLLLKPMDHDIVALTKCKAAIVPHRVLCTITEAHPHLTRLLWLSTLIDAAMHREWLAAIARGSALSRVARLFCELYLRLEVVKLAEAHSFRFPLTQIDLADALGLSVVHLNRTLRELREQGLLTWRRSTIAIHSWSRLAEVAEFDPAFLNLSVLPR